MPLRRIAFFVVVFFVINLAFDAYRAGGVTVGAVGSTAVVTILATVLYVVLMRVFSGRRKD